VSGLHEKDLYWVTTDGVGSPELLAKAGTEVLRPSSFSPDGHRLLFAKGTGSSTPRSQGVLLHVLELDNDRQSRVLMDAPYPVVHGSFSPDGRWIAYVTLESGGPGVHLRAANLTGRRWALSGGFATGPGWSRSGREVYFQYGADLVSVPVHPDSGPGEARVVLKNVFSEFEYGERSYEVGERRFLITPPRPSNAREIRVVVIPNWFDEVRARTTPHRE
jgi:serine/threonine-protein kinase